MEPKDQLERQAIERLDGKNPSIKDVADAVGMTANAVTKRLKKTRESLRAYLNERGYRL